MTLAERSTTVEKDRLRLDFLISEIGSIDEEIRGELDDFRHDVPLRADYGNYSRKRRARLDGLIREVNQLAENICDLGVYRRRVDHIIRRDGIGNTDRHVDRQYAGRSAAASQGC